MPQHGVIVSVALTIMPTLTLPGELSSLEPITDLVLEQARLAGLDEHATYQLRLAVDELATNIVIHGYQEHHKSGNIVVSVDVDEHDLTVVLEDTAVPYDPTKRDVERVEEHFDKPLEKREIGGLGIYFVRQAVDDFRYEWQDGRNRSTLVVHRPAVAGVGSL
jgi:anti-sigma regulatory factor (Ser/Thr protein kinase)